MKTYHCKRVSGKKIEGLFKRPAIDIKSSYKIVGPIIQNVKLRGEASVKSYAKKYDQFTGDTLRVSKKELIESEKNISKELKEAIRSSAKNIEKFHSEQVPRNYLIEITKGVFCGREFSPIENVGLYVPGGSAVLISTILMLGIPARIAGCKRIVLCSPCSGNRLHHALLYTAKCLGIKEIYKVGGAQAIAMMAYGTEKFRKVDKIFGPGNQYVTAAKSLVSIDPGGCSIDMPAGPSELLIIADRSANPVFVASDLLSQAEHGKDSQVILITTSSKIAESVKIQIEKQLKQLPRKSIAGESLKSSFILVVETIDDAIKLSNQYAPEHLIMNFKNSEKFLEKIKNAGSVFIGQYTPESAGDYSSGTNHSLPTYGFAKSYSGVSVEMFMKAITYQKISKRGLKEISDSIIKLAETENLEAHANAVKVRINDEY
jgi:histidinol dehydrogenase